MKTSLPNTVALIFELVIFYCACGHVRGTDRADYQFIITSQNPSGRITYDDGNFINTGSIGFSTGAGSGPWLADYWNSVGANDAYSYPGGFSNTSITGGAIGAGGPDAGSTSAASTGTLTMLFRTPGLSSGEADYVFHQHTGTANNLGLRILGTSSGTGALQLSIGNILYPGGALANVAGSTWYFFALDWNEATNLVHWSLGAMSGSGLTTGTLTMSAAGVVGDWNASFSSALIFGNTFANLSTGLNPSDAFVSNGVAGRIDEFASWPTILSNAQIQAQYSAINNPVPMPEIAIEQPLGTNIADGGTKALGAAIVGSGADFVFTIKNSGTADLLLTGSPSRIAVSGPDASMFTVVAQPSSVVVASTGTATFTVRFTPTSAGTKTAALLLPNNDADEGPFDIVVTGVGLDFSTDTDGDGLNDATEFQLAALGFNWQVSQPALVSTLFQNLGGARSNLNAVGFYTSAQVQALNVGTPLIQKNATTGAFTLTLGVQKSTNLINFSPFPMTAPQTLINGAGQLEFQFTVPGDTAFFRIQAQ